MTAFLTTEPIFLVGAALAVVVLYYFEAIHTRLLFGIGSLLAIYTLALLATGGRLSALVIALCLLVLIGTASRIKSFHLGINFMAADLAYLLPSGFKFLWKFQRRLVLACLAIIAAIAAIGAFLISMIAEETIPFTDRLIGLAVAGAVMAAGFVAAGGARRYDLAALACGRFHFSGFIASFLSIVGPDRHFRFIDAADTPLPLAAAPPSRATAPDLPDVVLILHELTFDPGVYGLPVSPAIETFLRPPGAIAGGLHVDIFGGLTWQSEFAVLIGISSQSFGASGQYVFHLAPGRLRHSLPFHLQSLGYRSLLISADYADFMNEQRFFKSIGIETTLFAKDYFADITRLGPYADRLDETLYAAALEQWKVMAADRPGPVLLIVNTLMNHSPHTRPILGDAHPQAREFARSTGAGELYSEYFVRMTESARAYAAFREAARGALPGRKAVFVRYGDHQPPFTRSLQKRLGASEAVLHRTFYAIDGEGVALHRSNSGEVLDAAFLGVTALQAADIPLGQVYATQAQLAETCGADYFGSDSEDKRRFHRTLIERGLVSVDR